MPELMLYKHFLILTNSGGLLKINCKHRHDFIVSQVTNEFSSILASTCIDASN